MIETNRGLLVLDGWAKMILSGEKTWEIRNRNTKLRGTIGIIVKGTGCIYGEVGLVDSFPLTEELFNNNVPKHRILVPDYSYLPDSYNTVWVLKNPVLYDKPVPYQHPRGAQVWVKL